MLGKRTRTINGISVEEYFDETMWPAVPADEDPTMQIPDRLVKAIEVAVTAERDRCAKIAESIRDGWAKDNESAWIAAQEIARRIRGGK